MKTGTFPLYVLELSEQELNLIGRAVVNYANQGDTKLTEYEQKEAYQIARELIEKLEF